MKTLKENFSYTTARLTIRFYQPEDFIGWQDLFSNMREKQNQWDWEAEAKSVLTKERFTQKQIRHNQERISKDIYYFCVENKVKNLVGICIIKEIKESNPLSVEIGFQLSNMYWGNGLGKELAKAVIDISRNELEIRNIRALVNKQNAVSIKILEGLGMKKVIGNETQWIFE